ncbi:Aspartic proteinase nepenthesin-1 [Apostasia shenzhenica]|uniref:Aspartic proteinase nepenthesin-1 n=1 Tax=Apostasia shenzhenica TaxID=1088818 RepID=A0A2I0ADS9_9ASPA|nr:Aspartic proteinase nepenthesin-1 [Apostasia shenzhenica]
MVGAPQVVLLLAALAAAAAAAALSPPSNPMPVYGCAGPPDSASTLRILPAFGPCSPLNPPISHSSADPLLSLADRDLSRILYLTSTAASGRRRPHRSFAPIAAGRNLLQSSTYVARASIGTPPQSLLVALDISSDAAWFPCSGCSGCPVSSPVFSPASSSSFSPVGCGSPQCSHVPNPSCPPSSPPSCAFNFTYGGSSIFASLAQDSLSLAGDSIKSYAFGCVRSTIGTSMPPQGLLGLGRGPLSFLSQTQSLYSSIFSYCLPSFRSVNFSGTLRLGLAGQPQRINTTPLLSNPRRPSLYYVKLTGIRVGRRTVSIPPAALAFDPATGAGTVFDSGTMFTRLVAPAYAAVRDEFRRRVNRAVTSLGGFDTCYDGPVAAPTITFAFEGMNMTLAGENVMIHSSSGSISCLAMAAAPANVNALLNVIAAVQQQNHRVLFDVPKGRVGVSRELCTS